jgi:hypothetical protein
LLEQASDFDHDGLLSCQTPSDLGYGLLPMTLLIPTPTAFVTHPTVTPPAPHPLDWPPRSHPPTPHNLHKRFIIFQI